jgi:hypothetical protein
MIRRRSHLTAIAAFPRKRPHHAQAIAPSPKPPAITRIERAIEAQRAQPLEAHGVLTCLYEVLLYAEGDDAVEYAQAAHAAAMLINKSMEDLDSVRTRPMIEELVLKTGLRVEDSAVSYWR